MGWLQGIGLAVGNNLLVGQQIEAQQAETEYRQQQTELSKLSNTQERRKQAARAEIGQDIQSLQASTKVGEAGVEEAIGFYDKASARLASKGDFDGAKQMSELSKGKLAEGEKMKETRVKAQQANMEALSQSAQDWMSLDQAGAPEAGAKQSEVARRAIAAGINVVDIPPPNSPAFARWAENVSLQVKTGSQRIDFVSKGVESERTFDRLKEQHKENLEERRAARAQSAGFQQSNLDLRRDLLEVSRSKAAGGAGVPGEEKISKNDFIMTQALSKEAQRAAKPYIEDRMLTVDLQSALALGTAPGDKQAQAILTSLNSKLKSRATNKIYADNKYFGSVADKLAEVLSWSFSGQYSDSTRDKLASMAEMMQQRVLDPGITRVERDLKAKAKNMGFKEEYVSINGDFNRTEAAIPGPAHLPKPEGVKNRPSEFTPSAQQKPDLVENGIEYYKVGTQVFSRKAK